MFRTNTESNTCRALAALLGVCLFFVLGFERFDAAAWAWGQAIDDPTDINDPTIINLAPQPGSGTQRISTDSADADGIPPVGPGTNASAFSPHSAFDVKPATPSVVASEIGGAIDSTGPSETLSAPVPAPVQTVPVQTAPVQTVQPQTANEQQEINGVVQPEQKQTVSPPSASIPLAAPEPETSKSVDGKPAPTGFSIIKILGTLAVLVGLLAVWIGLNKITAGNRIGKALSAELHVLGRGVLLGKAIYYVEFGKKILVVAANSNGLETLTEITDPAEINRLNQQLSAVSSAGTSKSESDVPGGKK